MAFRPAVTKIARLTAQGLGGTVIAGCSAITVYAFTDQGLGLRREIRFWANVTPVVFDYWWHVSSSSPLLKFQESFYGDDDDEESRRQTERAVNEEDELQQTSLLQGDGGKRGNNEIVKVSNEDEWNSDDGYEYKSGAQREMYKKLHNRNAPRIFSIIRDLGGLYIKLGQVLSVTALPVPSEYRELFRTLQSNVPGHEEFETVIKPTIESEFGIPLDELFESIDEIPCGAASIGQAHRARLLMRPKGINSEGRGNILTREDNQSDHEYSNDVIIKVQYPDAKWQVPADVKCVGDFLKVCVYFGVVDESSSRLSFEEFSRQFLAELDYLREARNLQEVYESSLDPEAPYIKRGVEIPKAFPELCSDQVITMTYIPGPKFEEEARKQLESLGIDTSRGIQSVVKEDAAKDKQSLSSSEKSKNMFVGKFAERIGAIVGLDNIFSLVRVARQAWLWSTALVVKSIQLASRTAPSLAPISQAWLQWAKDHENSASRAEMLDWTSYAIDALFDVHGYQIFNQGLFNADAHPGNILVIQNNNEICSSIDNNRRRHHGPKLGLIDYGQCKRLNVEERRKVARLVVSVVNEESDEEIASHCRDLGFVTKNNSTKFLSTLARLMFGKFQSEHLKTSWHKSLHEEDEIVYFPNELSMVYRTSLLLRGLAMSFQLNVSVGEKWREHAEAILDQ
mmetsp:Transcript_6166/g.15248  ORF Transcript_6166/g.15248 Transcript_6166/m.15248 type:complete len:681 (+) Transcript_6166:83-2125(+)